MKTKNIALLPKEFHYVLEQFCLAEEAIAKNNKENASAHDMRNLKFRSEDPIRYNEATFRMKTLLKELDQLYTKQDEILKYLETLAARYQYKITYRYPDSIYLNGIEVCDAQETPYIKSFL